MAVLPAFFVFLLFNCISGYILREDNGLLWPSEYHFKGEEINLLSKLTKPFEIWYSSSINRSRCDYYEGVEKKYYYGDEGEILDIHPITDKQLEAIDACFRTYTEEPQKDFLPDVSTLVYTGTQTHQNKEVDTWKSEEIIFNIIRGVVTVYVTVNKDGEHIPIRAEHQTYNLKSGAVIEHSIVEYYEFTDTFSDIVLFYDDEDNCKTTITDDDDYDYDDAQSIFLDDLEEIIEFHHPKALLDVDTTFEKYTKHHKKRYDNNEHSIRKMIFEKNLRKVQEVNQQNLGYKLTLNQFSDQTKEELHYLTGTKPTNLRNVHFLPFPHSLEEINLLSEELPENFDLRMEGVISPVRNQGECGSCWAFATTAAVEGAIARTNEGQLVDLSEQSLIDCAWGYNNSGCTSGTLDGAMKYVVKNGIPTEADYGGYKEEDGSCNLLGMDSTYTIRGFAMVTPRHPNALKLALIKYGPVAVNIHASSTMLQYSSGIFYDFECEGESVNHGVTVVGYGVRDGVDYWIIKNSWGEEWGEAGYVLMSMKNNNCFVQDTPFYPIV